LWIPPAIYLASTGGAFELEAATGSDGSIAVWHVRRDQSGAHRIRRITTPAPVSFNDGLPAFFNVVLSDSSGKKLLQTASPFCPGGAFGQSRVDASGPDRPTYPYYCGSDLTRATVWGIDQGWAAAPFFTFPASTIPDGDYTLKVTIDETYARQLDVPPNLVSVSLGVTISTMSLTSARAAAPAISSAAGPSGESSNRPSSVSSMERSGNDGVRESMPGGLPDLSALPASGLAVEHNTGNGHDYLDFGATIWNGGSGSLVVEGFRAGDAPFMPATQFIYRDGKPVRSAAVGRFEFDTRPGHNHWHMEDIAQYDLLDAAGGRVVLSDKQSFCLAPTDPIDLTRPGANWQPDRLGLWSACAGPESIWLREVLPAGWGDTYIQTVAGQSFDITTVPNGRYQLRVTADPHRRLLESAYDNNSSLLAIQLGGPPGARTVQGAKSP
jgi:hypothetical protein